MLDFWTTMGADARWRPVVALTVTLPIALVREAAGPMVTTMMTRYRVSGVPLSDELWMHIGGRVVEGFSFQKLIRSLHLVRHVGNRPEKYFYIAEFFAIHLGGGGAAHQRPVEHRFLAHLYVSALSLLCRDFNAHDQISLLQ